VLPYKDALEKLAPQKEMPEPGAITADEVTQLIKSVKKLKGSVYLMGQIAQYGQTASTVEIGITDKLDKQTILNAIRNTPLFGKVEFLVIPAGAVPPDAVPIVEVQA
jgi:hypothetical protein